MGLFNSNLINTLSKCKNPWKAIGFSALYTPFEVTEWRLYKV